MFLSHKKKFVIILGTVIVLSVTVVAFLVPKRAHAPVVPVIEKSLPPNPSRATSTYEIIGLSVESRKIEAYTYGTGDTHILFVGGMHGGYEWNSVLLAYSFMDELVLHPEIIPPHITVTVIPDLNPDGVYKVTGKEGRFALADISKATPPPGTGRFNAHNVDLNRNFACKWQPKSMWRGEMVNAGVTAFSEPETVALRDFVLKEKPDAVIFWHSQANAVYASECKDGILPGTLINMNAYAKAAGYPAIDAFNAYPVTGDSEGWLASIGIPAITVELSTHNTIEWDRNLKGIEALLAVYGTGSNLAR